MESQQLKRMKQSGTTIILFYCKRLLLVVLGNTELYISGSVLLQMRQSVVGRSLTVGESFEDYSRS
jgi:hypothetical protein